MHDTQPTPATETSSKRVFYTGWVLV